MGNNYTGTLKIIIGTAEEDSQISSVDQIFNITIEKILLHLKKTNPNRYKNRTEHQIERTKKRNCPWHSIVNTLNARSKDRALKTTREKPQVTHQTHHNNS